MKSLIIPCIAIKENQKKLSIEEKTIVGYFEEWTSAIKQMECEKHTNYNSVRNMLKNWGRIEQNTIHKKLNAEIFCAGTYNRRFTMLKEFVKMVNKERYLDF